MKHSSPSRSISAVADEVLAEVERAEGIKQAEVLVLREVVPRHHGEFGQLMHKVAEELRSDHAEVTYEDLRAFQEGRL